MKPFYILIILCGWLTSQPLFSQERKVTLRKNKNVQAKKLKHFLNDTKDSLVLESSEKIDYIYTISRQYKREVNDYIFAKSYALDTNRLSPGKHVVVVGQNGMKIVLVLYIEEELTGPAIVSSNSPGGED
ncbi:MAG: hypothetical protein ACWA5P_05620 [bacterium]